MDRDLFSGLDKLTEDIRNGVPPDVPDYINELAMKAVSEKPKVLTEDQIRELAHKIASVVCELTD